jgi:hypothetical protein
LPVAWVAGGGVGGAGLIVSSGAVGSSGGPVALLVRAAVRRRCWFERRSGGAVGSSGGPAALLIPAVW